MTNMRKPSTVTQGKWCVSTTTPPMDGIGGSQLNVFIPRDNILRKYQYGDGHGRKFNTSDEAFQWALERGYLQVYYRRK